jgi:hypothetical protein
MPKPAWLQTTKSAPEKKSGSIPDHAQWLSGEGDGSWFAIETEAEDTFIITRFSAKGKIECQSIFECITPKPFSLALPYIFVHLSHCKEVRIMQNEDTFIFSRKERII